LRPRSFLPLCIGFKPRQSDTDQSGLECRRQSCS